MKTIRKVLGGLLLISPVIACIIFNIYQVGWWYTLLGWSSAFGIVILIVSGILIVLWDEI